MTIWRRGKVNDVIVHSDQGNTYASGGHQQYCRMGRKGECQANTLAESFWHINE